MEITSVTIRKYEKENSNLRGMATILIDNCFAVHGIRILEGERGFFIDMPSWKTTDGGHRSIAHPINQEVRTMIQDKILKAYNEAE